MVTIADVLCRLPSSPSPVDDNDVTNRQTDEQKIEDLSSYISWARNHIHPVLTGDASEALVKAYVDMRNMGADSRSSDRRITATTRQLESMIRLSEAHARMRYSLQVEVSFSFSGHTRPNR